jgi:hypothetical protein
MIVVDFGSQMGPHRLNNEDGSRSSVSMSLKVIVDPTLTARERALEAIVAAEKKDLPPEVRFAISSLGEMLSGNPRPFYEYCQRFPDLEGNTGETSHPVPGFD